MRAVQGDRYSSAVASFRQLAVRLMPQRIRVDEDVLLAIQRWGGLMGPSSPVPLIMDAW
jgi:hypothetical protein